MQTPKLDLYRIFLAAASTGNYTEAGKQLFMTQSAVSQAIRQLERALDTTLFYREGRSMVLTAEGKALSQHLEQAFQAIERGERSISALRNLSEGVLHVASSDTLCHYVLLPWLERFHQQYPGIRLQITNRPSPACLELVAGGQADVALVNRPEQAAPELVLADVLPYQDCFVAGNRYVGLSESERSLTLLLKEPLILLESDSSTRQNLNRWAGQHQLDVSPEIELGSVEILLELVRMNLGIGWIPGYALPAAQRAGLLHIRTREVSPQRQVALARNKNHPETRAAKAFWGMMNSHPV